VTKRAVLMGRVSTTDQAEKGYSLPSQMAACREYAERQGFVVVAEITDDCSGAIPVKDRPGGSKVYRMLDNGEVDVVVQHTIDRTARDKREYPIEFLLFLRYVQDAGAELHFVDTGKADGGIVNLFRAWQAADERRKIRERSMRGKRAKARSGRVVGGRPPYGYRHVRDSDGKIVTFEPVEEEAKIVLLIYQWYVYGDETGKPLAGAAIARRLSEMRVPTPGEVRPGYNRTREPGMWRPGKVLKIISHEVYAGVWHYGVRIGPTRNTRPPEEHIAVSVPAIIDRELWTAAQERRGRNKRMARRNGKRNYLLRGLIKCGCGCSMCGEFFSNHRYYTCSWRQNHHAGIEERTCFARSVRADAIEPDIWEGLVSIFADTARLEELLRIAQQEELEAFNPKREELAAVEAMIIDAEREAGEIGQALKKASGIVGKALEQDMQNVNQRYDALCKRQRKLTAELSATTLTEAAIQDAIRFAEDVRVGIENADYETKRYNLETLKIQVTVQDGRYHVESLIGDWEGEIRKLPRASRKSKGGDKVGIVSASRLQGTNPPEYHSPANRLQPEG